MSFFEARDSINLDITFRCPIACSKCPRQQYYKHNNLAIEGMDMSMSAFIKILAHFKRISFCGQISDPVNHPEFINFLKLTCLLNKTVGVHTANSHKSFEWYEQAFLANPNAFWYFGLSGLPKDSHKYRVNQNGERLFQIMLLAKKILKTKPLWQYIVFSYNENDVEIAKEIAAKEGFVLKLLLSTRYNQVDNLRPKNYLYDLKNHS